MRKFFKKNFKIAFMVLLIFSFSVQPVLAGNYDDEKNDAQNDIYQAEQAIKDLESKKADVDAYMEQVDASINQMNANISSINSQSVAKQQEIDTSNAIILQTEADIEQQYIDMKIRIKFMYENADTQYTEMILGSENFSDFLNKADYFSKLTTYDREMIVRLEETKVQLEAQKAQLEQEKQALDVLKADALAQKQQSELLLDEKEQQMAVYNSQIDMEKKEIEAQQAILAKIVALEQSGSTDYFEGIFTWPTNPHPITSPFGMRYHPIYHEYRLHQGIDIGVSSGTTIVAACTGTVTIASYGYNGGAGNYVAISHGGSLSTVYYHCSSLLVNAGDLVIEGTPIALVGSSGASTGPHLHFGVIKNGSYVEPMDYLSH